jgi:hypothetical protein
MVGGVQKHVMRDKELKTYVPRYAKRLLQEILGGQRRQHLYRDDH